jgi:ABC-type Fe3+/spermidine/putrescine transport system ATPase subunit
VETALGRLRPADAEWATVGQQVTVLIRPEAARLVAKGAHSDDVVIEGTVRECSFRGGHCRLVVHHQAGLELAFELSWDMVGMLRPGESVALTLRAEAISLLAGEMDEQATID